MACTGLLNLIANTQPDIPWMKYGVDFITSVSWTNFADAYSHIAIEVDLKEPELKVNFQGLSARFVLRNGLYHMEMGGKFYVPKYTDAGPIEIDGHPRVMIKKMWRICRFYNIAEHKTLTRISQSCLMDLPTTPLAIGNPMNQRVSEIEWTNLPYLTMKGIPVFPIPRDPVDRAVLFDMTGPVMHVGSINLNRLDIDGL